MKVIGLLTLCLFTGTILLTSCESKKERQVREMNEGMAEMEKRVDQFKRDGDYIKRVENDPGLSTAEKKRLQEERLKIMTEKK